MQLIKVHVTRNTNLAQNQDVAQNVMTFHGVTTIVMITNVQVKVWNFNNQQVYIKHM